MSLVGGSRRPAVAGSFYPSDPGDLDALVDECIAEGGHRHPAPPGAPTSPLGILVPHAGLVYSGPAAAVGWSALASARPVEAPDGVEAAPVAPPASEHSAQTVGRPRLSRISRA